MRRPQIWTPFLSTCVNQGAQRTRVSTCSLSSFADLAHAEASKRDSDLGASLTKSPVVPFNFTLNGLHRTSVQSDKKEDKELTSGQRGSQARTTSSRFPRERQDVAFTVKGTGDRVLSSGIQVQGLRLRVQNFGLQVQGFGL